MVGTFMSSMATDEMNVSFASLPDVLSCTQVCAMSDAKVLRFSKAVIHCLPFTIFGMELT